MNILDLSEKKVLKNTKHWKAELNQLYHPTAKYPIDSIDIVYSRSSVEKTKFLPILLKEWFYLIKKDGYLVIDYAPNKNCDFKKLEETMWWLWKKKYDIIFHGEMNALELKNTSTQSFKKFITLQENYYKNNLDSITKLPVPLKTSTIPLSPNGYLRFVCRKTKFTQIAGDSIDKWTFGIITNGVRLDLIEKIIDSIKAQKIPHYEVILCGRYMDRAEKNIKYIPFNERDDKGWITKKKNIIVDNATYENICIIHDRVALKKDWYRGMKKWGNCFEHLACAQYFNDVRTNDWLLHEKLPGIEYSFVSHLDFRDWDLNACQGGQHHIVKKRHIQKVYWDESYLWGRAEDVKVTNDLRYNGHIIRCNPYASLDTLIYKFGDLPQVTYNSQKLSQKRIGNMKRIVARQLYMHIAAHRVIQNFVLNSVQKLSKKNFIK